MCEGLDQITLSMPTAAPVSGSWTPGSDLFVGATMTNAGASDFSYYPGLRVTSDHPRFIEPAENFFFALFSGVSMPLSAQITTDPAIPAGTEVTFTIEVLALDLQCGEQDSLTVVATVDAP